MDIPHYFTYSWIVRLRAMGQLLASSQIPEAQPRISAYSQAEGSQPKTAAMTASGAWQSG
ncbi:MAG: hypothetical protein C5S45_04075 [Candidatus Methanocomedens sp.]|nr:MAG: hypothetical protein C5S45_04075 [ANME-2 cluster archaeon]